MSHERVAETIVDPTAQTRRRRGRLRLSMVPTLFTLGNLICGVLAISYLIDAGGLFAVGLSASAQARVALAGWMILLGMVFDALDGRIARITRTTTNFGGQLDSLADVVSFGVAPALLGKALVEHVLHSANVKMAFLTAGFFAVCATLRLARYNAEHEEPDAAVRTFVGLPTPGAAGVLAGLAICHREVLRDWAPGPLGEAIAANVIRFGLLIGLGLLMVSRVPYVHVANRLLAGRRPVGRVALLLLLIVLAAHLDPAYVLASIFLIYALSGPVSVIPRLVRGKRSEVVPELFE